MQSHHPKAVFFFVLLVISFVGKSLSFAPIARTYLLTIPEQSMRESGTLMYAQRKQAPKIGKTISGNRRKQLGIGEGEDEYDLGVALDVNTDPFITKVIAGSLILVILALLVAGIIVPALTDYGEGVCRPLLTGGRC